MLQNILNGTWGAVYTYFMHERKARILNNNTVDTKGNKITKRGLTIFLLYHLSTINRS